MDAKLCEASDVAAIRSARAVHLGLACVQNGRGWVLGWVLCRAGRKPVILRRGEQIAPNLSTAIRRALLQVFRVVGPTTPVILEPGPQLLEAVGDVCCQATGELAQRLRDRHVGTNATEPYYGDIYARKAAAHVQQVCEGLSPEPMLPLGQRSAVAVGAVYTHNGRYFWAWVDAGGRWSSGSVLVRKAVHAHVFALYRGVADTPGVPLQIRTDNPYALQRVNKGLQRGSSDPCAKWLSLLEDERVARPVEFVQVPAYGDPMVATAQQLAMCHRRLSGLNTKSGDLVHADPVRRQLLDELLVQLPEATLARMSLRKGVLACSG